jgi:hypothetical protein
MNGGFVLLNSSMDISKKGSGMHRATGSERNGTTIIASVDCFRPKKQRTSRAQSSGARKKGRESTMTWIGAGVLSEDGLAGEGWIPIRAASVVEIPMLLQREGRLLKIGWLFGFGGHPLEQHKPVGRSRLLYDRRRSLGRLGLRLGRDRPLW